MDRGLVLLRPAGVLTEDGAALLRQDGFAVADAATFLPARAQAIATVSRGDDQQLVVALGVDGPVLSRIREGGGGAEAAAALRLALHRAAAAQRHQQDVRLRLEEQAGARAEVVRRSDALWEAREQLERDQAHRLKLAQLVAHDLKNHLSVVKTNIEFALLDVPEETPGRDAIVQAAEIAENAFRLVGELIAVEQPGASRPAAKPFQVAALVEEGLARQAALARMVGVRVEHDVEDGLVAQGDRRMVARVLENLVDNALRHGEASYVRVAASAGAQGRLELAVEDDGIGLPPAACAAVSDAMETATGGLAFCRQAARAHGAELVAEPRSARGTRIVVTLPAVATAARAARAA